jgi:FkbM family methyltransferase
MAYAESFPRALAGHHIVKEAESRGQYNAKKPKGQKPVAEWPLVAWKKRQIVANNYHKLHFTLRHTMMASLSRCFGNTVYTSRHGLIKGMRRKGGLGFLPSFLVGSADNTPELTFLSKLALDGAVVYDIGGFVGVLTLFFSRSARQVVTFEPNPANYARILENLRLNNITNVRVRNVAIGESESCMTLVYDPLMPGAGSADPSISGQIRDTARRHLSVEIHTTRLDDEIRRGLAKPDFIKIDVEGMEISALRGGESFLRERHPRLYLEMHGATQSEKVSNVGQILRLLHDYGYEDVIHVETGRRVVLDDYVFACRGHLYVSQS